jgi:hypothetical protein
LFCEVFALQLWKFSINFLLDSTQDPMGTQTI